MGYYSQVFPALLAAVNRPDHVYSLVDDADGAPDRLLGLPDDAQGLVRARCRQVCLGGVGLTGMRLPPKNKANWPASSDWLRV